jgi:spermidine synthase
MTRPQAWLAPGLALTTFATLLVEILSTRLLSVLTWYHLSFLAVSLAMLGMASGAVFVFLRGEHARGGAAAGLLVRATLAMAVAIPAAHLCTLVIPIPPLTEARLSLVLPLAVFVVLLGVPFYFSGVAVTVALTRMHAPIGRLYAWDLAGAAAGCLSVIPLLVRTNLTSAMFIAAAATALAAWCFSRVAGRRARTALLLAAAFLAIAGWNARENAFPVLYPKNQGLWLSADNAAMTAWTTHAYVALGQPGEGPVYYWGPGRGAEGYTAVLQWLTLDGEAATPVTKWDGRPESLAWVPHDVTSLPYHVRQGDVAVIGVGGGRDILSAIWGRSRSITGIEINRALVDLLERRARDFANIATRPDVTLVNDEARAHLARTARRFDILQMSLIDTWAATGAGAFTLSENGLYTREGWRILIDRLTPRGVFSVSRWFSPSRSSETSRLVSLAVAALLDRQVAAPGRHLVLAASGNVATLMVSPSPFDEADRAAVEKAVGQYGFRILFSPWHPAGDPLLRAIAGSSSRGALAAAIVDDRYDYSAPTDERPFFFNMLRPASLLDLDAVPQGGVAGGNLRATVTLLVLLALTTVLVVAIVVWPLVRSGRPAGLSAGVFAIALAYFGLIGAGFMLVQIPFLQRFSVYLGHPTWTLAVILFGMILFTGVGSALSDRVPTAARWLPVVPLAIAAMLVADTALIQLIVDRSSSWSLAGRTGVVLATLAPLSVLLGLAFPIGMRLVGAASDQATAWLWGVNGACGVLASVGAVAVSMWFGIHRNLWLAALAYVMVALALRALQRRLGATMA